MIGKRDILTSWDSHKIRIGVFNTRDVLESMTFQRHVPA